MTVSARRVAFLSIEAAATSAGRVAAPGRAPPPAARHPADLRLARRTFDPIAPPLFSDDSTAFRALECFATRDQRVQQCASTLIRLIRSFIRSSDRLELRTVLFASFPLVYSL